MRFWGNKRQALVGVGNLEKGNLVGLGGWWTSFDFFPGDLKYIFV